MRKPRQDPSGKTITKVIAVLPATSRQVSDRLDIPFDRARKALERLQDKGKVILTKRIYSVVDTDEERQLLWSKCVGFLAALRYSESMAAKGTPLKFRGGR
jgi:hypothetical protein